VLQQRIGGVVVRLKTLSPGLVVVMLSVLLIQITPANAVVVGNEGCTPGFWKNHTDAWEEYLPSDTLGEVWAIPNPGPLAGFSDDTLLDALNYGGGPGVTGGAKILFRAAVAAYLNAASDELGYPLRRYLNTAAGTAMQTVIDGLLASPDRAAMLSYASFLDQKNNLGADFCD
jgi:hypothetical protein